GLERTAAEGVLGIKGPALSGGTQLPSVPGLPGADVLAQADILLRTTSKPPAPPPSSLGSFKKHGQDAAKALIDGFKEGIVGLQAAIDLIATKSTADLKALFDPMSKGARENAEETKAALEAMSKGIDAMLKELGSSVKVSTAELAGMPKALRDALGGKAAV